MGCCLSTPRSAGFTPLKHRVLYIRNQTTPMCCGNRTWTTGISEYLAENQVKETWRYDTTVWLSHRLFALDRCLDDRTIQKAARQFKNLTLESYATMIGASTLDIVAAYQRRWKCDERSVFSNACYLFQGDGELAKDCIRASPMRREQLEGVAVVGTPYGDYSLRTGAKVMNSRGEEGVWHTESKGDTATISHADLVGAGILPVSDWLS